MRKIINPIHFNSRREYWQYMYNGKASIGFKDKIECGKAYVKNLVQREPKFESLFAGKGWKKIFELVGIVL